MGKQCYDISKSSTGASSSTACKAGLKEKYIYRLWTKTLTVLTTKLQKFPKLMQNKKNVSLFVYIS
jgi:hypothetical protein